MAKRKGRETHPTGEKMSVPPEERARLKALREKRGWSQDELADRANITQGTVSNFERGTGQAYVSVYQAIVAALHDQNVTPEAKESFRRISAGAAQLEEKSRRIVEDLIEQLLAGRSKPS